MDQGQEEEQYDSIYENDDSSERFNIAELLKEKSLDQLLTEDREHIKEAEQEFQWYHGKITRDTAEDALRRGLDLALFLTTMLITCRAILVLSLLLLVLYCFDQSTSFNLNLSPFCPHVCLSLSLSYSLSLSVSLSLSLSLNLGLF